MLLGLCLNGERWAISAQGAGMVGLWARAS